MTRNKKKDRAEKNIKFEEKPTKFERRMDDCGQMDDWTNGRFDD